MTKRIVIFLSLFLFNSPALGANFMVIEGKLTDSGGLVPVEEASVAFEFEVIDDTANECVLYSEQHTVNMSGSGGFFSLNLGLGTQSGVDYEDTLPFQEAFNNNYSHAGITNCVAGTSFVPTISSHRKLRISYNDGINGWQTLQQNIEIGKAAYAQSAMQLGGFTSADFIQVNVAGPVLNQANLENIFDSAASVTELRALIDGTSSQYNQGVPVADVDNNNQRIINVAVPAAGTDAANRNYVDQNLGQSSIANLAALNAGNTNEVLTWNGTQWINSGVPSDATKLDVAGGSMTGALAMGGNGISGISTLATTGNATVGGDLTVSGAGNSAFTGSLSANGISSSGNVVIYNGPNFMGFQAGAGASNFVWTLPDTDGGALEVLQTNGGGQLQWAPLPAGATIGTAAGNAMGADAVNNCLANEKLQMSAGPVYTWSCVPDLGGVMAGLVDVGSTDNSLNLHAFGATRLSLQTEDADFNISGSIVMPNGTSAQRPGAPINGMFRYNEDNQRFEGYENGVWEDFVTSASAVGDFMRDGSLPMTGDFDAGNNHIVNLSSGTALAPALSFSGDVQTGFYRPAAGTIVFVENSNEMMRMDSTGMGVENSISIRGGGIGGELRLEQNGGGNAITLRAPTTVPGPYAIEFPNTAPAANEALVYSGAVFQWTQVGDFMRDGSQPMTGNIDMNGQFIQNLGMGSITTAALSFGDADTGLYSTGAGVLNFTVDNAEQARFDSGGLAMFSPLSADNILSTGPNLQIEPLDDLIYNADMDGNATGIHSFRTNAITRMVINNNGFVGIGTVAPNTQLEVRQANPANDMFRVADLGGLPLLDVRDSGQIGIGGNADAGTQDMVTIRNSSGSTDILKVFNNGATPVFTITDAGDVGIGNTSPGAPLDVSGEVRADRFVAATSVQVAMDSGCVGAPDEGKIRWNNDVLEVCNGTDWLKSTAKCPGGWSTVKSDNSSEALCVSAQRPADTYANAVADCRGFEESSICTIDQYQRYDADFNLAGTVMANNFHDVDSAITIAATGIPNGSTADLNAETQNYHCCLD